MNEFLNHEHIKDCQYLTMYFESFDSASQELNTGINDENRHAESNLDTQILEIPIQKQKKAKRKTSSTLK